MGPKSFLKSIKKVLYLSLFPREGFDFSLRKIEPILKWRVICKVPGSLFFDLVLYTYFVIDALSTGFIFSKKIVLSYKVFKQFLGKSWVP